MPRSSVYLDLCLSRWSGTGRKEYRGAIQGDAITPPMLVRIASIASGAPASTSFLACACASLRAPADGVRAGAPHRLGELARAGALRERAERDRVRELGDRGGVAQRDEQREADRVEPVAREQLQVGLGDAHDARHAVVQQVALVDRLDEQRVLLAPARRSRSARGDPRGTVARLGGGGRTRRAGCRRPLGIGRDERRHQPPVLTQHHAQPLERVVGCVPAVVGALHRRAHAAVRCARPAKAAAAASTVRSICSPVCASDGNHASNCDGGG